MSRYPYHSRWTDNRRRRSSGVRAFDAQQSGPFGMMQTQKPVILGAGSDPNVPITAYNVVKLASPDTVFADNKGPIETASSQTYGDEILCRISPFTAYNDPFSLFASIPTIALYTRRDDLSWPVAVAVQIGICLEPWDADAVTYNTKPLQTGALAGIVSGGHGAQVTSVDRNWNAGDTLGYNKWQANIGSLRATSSVPAGSAASTTIIESSAAIAAYVGGVIEMTSGDNDGIARTIAAVDTTTHFYTVSPAFPEPVLELETYTIWPLIHGFSIRIAENLLAVVRPFQFGRLSAIDALNVEKVYLA